MTTGNLPSRFEVTFASSRPTTAGPVKEAAQGYLQALAFDHHLNQHQLTAVHATPRQVVHSASLFQGPAPVTAFDVHPPAAGP